MPATIAIDSQAIRAPRPQKVLWMWTGVSAVIHALMIAALCGVSYLGALKREAASKAKQELADAASKKAEADEAAKAAAAPHPAGAPGTPAPAGAPAKESTASTEKAVATPAPAPVAPAGTPAASPQAEAEKILGIDKVAKPGETPKSPFGGSNDDLLKDLK